MHAEMCLDSVMSDVEPYQVANIHYRHKLMIIRIYVPIKQSIFSSYKMLKVSK